jgi:hypothetical protein
MLSQWASPHFDRKRKENPRGRAPEFNKQRGKNKTLTPKETKDVKEKITKDFFQAKGHPWNLKSAPGVYFDGYKFLTFFNLKNLIIEKKNKMEKN